MNCACVPVREAQTANCRFAPLPIPFTQSVNRVRNLCDIIGCNHHTTHTIGSGCSGGDDKIW